MDVSKMVRNLVLLIVGIIVVFLLIAETSTDLVGAGNNLSATELPLAGLFSGSGVVMLIFMAGVLLAIVALALSIGKGKK